MELPQSNTLIPVCSYTRTELLSLRTKTSLLSLSTVDRLKELNIGYHLLRRHRSSRGVKRKKGNLHPFIVASCNAKPVKGNDMACKRCEISTFINDDGGDLYFMRETWLSAQGDEASTVEFVCTAFHQTDKTILLTLCLLNSCLTLSITQTTSQDCRFVDMNIHFDNPLQSLT